MNADRREIRKVTDHMNELLYREELLRLQRSRVDWLRDGDQNTKFFHRRAVWRARKNKVKALVDEHGVRHCNQDAMRGMINSYFQALFQEEKNLVCEPLLNLFESKVTEDMNNTLCAEFSEKKSQIACFKSDPSRPPVRTVFLRDFSKELGGCEKRYHTCC